MKKLFKLKKWLTLEETAKRLTTSFEEEISKADCLQLALDRHITISVLLDSSVYVIAAEVLKTTQRESLAGFTISTSENGAIVRLLDEQFLPNSQLDYEYETIKRTGSVFSLPNGIYDLPMVGAEELDVMHVFDLAQGRSPREFVNIEGAFIKTEYGMVTGAKTKAGIKRQRAGYRAWLDRQRASKAGRKRTRTYTSDVIGIGSDTLSDISTSTPGDALLAVNGIGLQFMPGDRLVAELPGGHCATVQMMTTSPKYGGVRWWYACPECGKRKAALYLSGAVLMCRQCAGIHYASQSKNTSR